jgi:hypothetical protein
MQEAIDILRHSETVLVKKIKGMKDGKPKYAAAQKLSEIRNAVKILQYQASDSAQLGRGTNQLNTNSD